MYYLLSIFVFLSLFKTGCPGFNIEGYHDMFYEVKNGIIYCAVDCDTANHYYPAGFYRITILLLRVG